MHRYWIVIPCYNEERWIAQTIEAVANQSETDFGLVVVDNASTDATPSIVEATFARFPDLDAVMVREPEKGTGCAADTGFRYAIEHGAEIVFRTDADCLPTPTWFASLRATMERHGYDSAAGRLRVRTDDVNLTPARMMVSRAGMVLVPLLGKLLKSNRGKEYQRSYVMLPGPNVAIRKDAYEACGGYRRTSFEHAFLDKEIANALRRITPKIGYDRRAVVLFSERRTEAYGVRGTIKWIRSRGGVKSSVDVR